MSEIKTDKLSPRTGAGTVTLGTSGDSYTIPAGVTLTNAGTLTNSGTASGFGLFTSYAIIADQKAQNTAGGTFTSGAWRTRDLQTEIADPNGIVSISANQFTLAAGSYLIRWGAVARLVDRHQTRLYDVTGTAEVGVGDSLYATNSYRGDGWSRGYARVTPSGSNVYRIEHRCDTSYSADGLGLACNYTTEQYCTVEIFKEA